MKRRIFMQDITNLPLREALEKFINFKITMDKAEATIKYYNDRFNEFCDFLETEKKINLTSQVYKDDINDFILYRRRCNPNISNHTINNYLRAIRAILYYCMDESYTEPFHIPMVSAPKVPKEGYTQLEQEKLIEKPDIKKCNFPQYRNWVIVCHLLASANRTRTLLFIKNKDVKLNERIISLTEVKNNEGYEMPIDDVYLPILKEYMRIRGGEPDDYLFCNQYGKQLTPSGLRTVMSKYNKDHGVETTSIHRFRNTFAKNWLLEDGSEKKLQHALGHKTSAMVDEYAKLYGRELRKDFSKFTPLAKLKEVVAENKKIKMKRKMA